MALTNVKREGGVIIVPECEYKDTEWWLNSSPSLPPISYACHASIWDVYRSHPAVKVRTERISSDVKHEEPSVVPHYSLTHRFSTNGAYINPVMGFTWNSINPNMPPCMSSSIKTLSLLHRLCSPSQPLVCTASKGWRCYSTIFTAHTTPRWTRRAGGKWLFLERIKSFSDPCVPDSLPYSSLTVHQHQITSQVPAWKEAEAKLRELYQFCEVLRYRVFFFLSYRLQPLRQQATHSNRTLTTRTAWNKHKLTTPPNGNSCYRNSFICYSTLQKSALRTHAHTPPLPNKPVSLYHTLWSVRHVFTIHSYSVELCFRFYTLWSGAFCCALATSKATVQCRFVGFLQLRQTAVSENLTAHTIRCI